jgi:hypothetical protein
MCAGGDIMDKKISEAAQILKRISNGQRTNEIGKDVVERSKTTKASPRCLLNFLKNESEVKEDEPTIQEIEDPLPKVREVISNVKNVETNINAGRSMWNAR